MRQTATFSVLDNRTKSLRNVQIVVGVSNRPQEPRGNFLSRNVKAAVAGIKKAAQSVKEHAGYVAEMGKGAYTTVIQGLKKWAGGQEEPLASAKKGGGFNPQVPTRKWPGSR
jgi:hypothetical protein